MITNPQLFSSPAPIKNRWQRKKLLLSHLVIALLLFTLFFPPAKTLWRHIDTAFFRLINPTLAGPSWWKTLWALANHKWADWVEDLCILTFFAIFVASGNRFVRAKRIAELIICTLYSAAIIYFFNRILVRDHLHFSWPSPSATLDHVVRLSDQIPGLHIKDSSQKSFPGDHATTALLFASFYSYLARGRLALCAFSYAALLCLPRLITGAHWLSDILIGATSIVLFFLSWLFFSPLFTILSSKLESFFLAITTLGKKIYAKTTHKI